MIPRLETERLVLRGWREADHTSLAAFWADPHLTQFVGGEKAFDDVWRLIALYLGHWQVRGYGIFAVETAKGELAGWAGPWFPSGWPEPEIGWGLMPGFAGRGYATEAARAARRYAYDTLGWSTAISLIDPANAPSLRVARRLDARPDGTWSCNGRELGIFRHPSPSSLH